MGMVQGHRCGYAEPAVMIRRALKFCLIGAIAVVTFVVIFLIYYLYRCQIGGGSALGLPIKTAVLQIALRLGSPLAQWMAEWNSVWP